MTILRTMRHFSSMNIAASILLFLTAIAAAIIADITFFIAFTPLINFIHLICFLMEVRI